MKKILFFSFILGFSSLMAWAIFSNITKKTVSLKSSMEPIFVLSDTQKICINELLKIQKFYLAYPVFKAQLLKSITPEGGKGEQLNLEILSDGINYLMKGDIALTANNAEFFAAIDHESREIVIGYPNSQNPLGYKYTDFTKAFKDSLIDISFKRSADIATISYTNYGENTVTDMSYHYSTGEIMRITETFFDSWDGEEEIVKITEDCIIKSFKPLKESVSISKFQFGDFIEQIDSTFKGKGICKDYKIADTRPKN